MRVLQLLQWLTPHPYNGGVMRSAALGRILSSFADVDAVGFHPVDENACLESAHSLRHYRNLHPVPLGGRLSRVRSALLNFSQGYSLRSSAFRAPAYRARVRELLRTTRYDVIQVETLSILQNLDATQAEVPIVYSAHNVESVLSSRLLDARARHYVPWSTRTDLVETPARDRSTLGAAARCFGFDRRRTESEERQALETSRLCLAVSESDKALLERLATGRCCPIHVIPNCVDDEIAPATLTTPVAGREVVCIAAFGWYPNLQGAVWFLDEVLPILERNGSLCSIRFVGSGIRPGLAAKIRARGCAYDADVPATLPFLHRARAAIVPLLIGGGTRIKIVEAWAAGVPVISTRIGAEGLDCEHAVDAMLADDAEAFATALHRVLTDDDLHQRLRLHGLRRSEAMRWSKVAPVVERLYASLLFEDPPASPTAIDSPTLRADAAVAGRGCE